jgi:hypothetical protein
VRVCEEKTNEPRTVSWGWIGFQRIQKIPKRDFLDGALVGAGSLKPKNSRGRQAEVEEDERVWRISCGHVAQANYVLLLQLH